MKSAFFNEGRQRKWMYDRHDQPTEELMSMFRRVHERLFHNIFINPKGVLPEDNQRRYETLEDIATILKDRGHLPEKFNGYALDVDELPWKKSLTSPSEPSRS